LLQPTEARRTPTHSASDFITTSNFLGERKIIGWWRHGPPDYGGLDLKFQQAVEIIRFTFPYDGAMVFKT
jgi:hypothetical protein